MRNYFKIFGLIMMLALSGCGSGATSADPLGTDTISATASVISLGAGESSVITATVKHADGKAATLRSVSFSIAPNNSGGTIAVTDDGKNNGIATATYTAGAGTPASSVQDTVRASIDNGAAAPVSITRAAVPSAGTVGGQIALFAASKLTVSAGQSSILTANVTDGTGTPLSGVTVTFSVPTKNSGAPTLTGGGIAVTDGTGNAITIYSPGTASPTTSVDDIVQASLTNGSTRAVTITRSASAVAVGNVISLDASQTTLSAGQNSTITATVTDTSGNPVSGQTVTFTLPIKGSGVPTLSAASATTDGTGNAITIYSPGTASATSTVEDVVQASITSGSTRTVSITRSGGNVTTYILPLAPSKTIVTASQSSIITATVKNSASNPVSGETVNFTISIKGSGAPTLSAASVVTDTNGNAVTIYTPGVGSPTAAVEDAIQATLTNGSGQAVIVTRSGNVSPATNYVTLAFVGPAASTTSVGAINRSGVITATVTNASGNPVSGVTVTFSITIWNSSGVFPAANPVYPAGPTLSNLTGVTDGNGKAITIYTAGGTSPATDVIRAVIIDGDAAIVIADY